MPAEPTTQQACLTCVPPATNGGPPCPMCGGGLVPRPIRPRRAWRAGTGLGHDPADTERRRLRYTMEEVRQLTDELWDVLPQER